MSETENKIVQAINKNFTEFKTDIIDVLVSEIAAIRIKLNDVESKIDKTIIKNNLNKEEKNAAKFPTKQAYFTQYREDLLEQFKEKELITDEIIEEIRAESITSEKNVKKQSAKFYTLLYKKVSKAQTPIGEELKKIYNDAKKQFMESKEDN